MSDFYKFWLYLLDSKLEMEIIMSELVKNFHAYSHKYRKGV